MNNTTSRKVLLAILGVGLTGLAVDQLFLGALGPAEAGAAPGSPAATNVTSDGGNAALRTDIRTAALIADRLDAYAVASGVDTSATPDVFSLAPAWGHAPVEPPPEPEPVEGMTAEEFLAAHQLNAVLIGGASPIAVIDGVAMGVGRALDGFVLESIDEDAVVLRSVRETVTLRVARPDRADR